MVFASLVRNALFKVVIGFVAAIAWIVVAVVAVIAVIWALRVL